LALAAGLSVSFVVLGLGVAALGPTLGVHSDTVARAASLMMIAFGFVMLVPALSARFSAATAGFAARADMQFDQTQSAGLMGQFLSGALLGAVWSPCIGPTLGAAIALASTGENLGHAGVIMLAFALGVSTLILTLAYGAQAAIRRRQASLRAIAERAKPVVWPSPFHRGLAGQEFAQLADRFLCHHLNSQRNIPWIAVIFLRFLPPHL
jgi:cytochrome c biogenesis protein CcdA